MSIECKKLEKFLLADIQNLLAAENAYAVRKQLNEILDGNCRHLVLNLGKTEVLTSYVIGIFVMLWKRLSKTSGTLHLIAEQEDLRSLFHKMNLDSIMQVFATEEEFRGAMLGEGPSAYGFTTRQKGAFTVIQVREPLNIFCGYDELDRKFTELFDQKILNISLDLSRIEHLYSEVIGIIIRWLKRIDQAKGRFYILGLNEDLRARLKSLELDQIVSICIPEEKLESL